MHGNEIEANSTKNSSKLKKGQQSRRMKQTYKTTKKNIQIGLEIAQYL